jgi:hypothetical protein
MSRRRSPSEIWAQRGDVVRIICTDKGQHPEKVLGKVGLRAEDWQCTVVNNIWADGDTAFRDGFTSKSEATTRAAAPLSPDAVAAQHQAMLDGRMAVRMTDRWRCRKCGRDQPIRRAELVAAARTWHEHGRHRLDLSLVQLP